MPHRYFAAAKRAMEEAERTQMDAIKRAGELVARAIADGHMVYVFGASHASIPAQELFYRAGGLVPISPILAPGLTTDVRPITRTSAIERMAGYARVILQDVSLGPGDVLFAISVSGRNTVSVEMAEEARARGATVVAVTSMPYTKTVTSRAPSGQLLYQVADLVLDIGGVPGDAAVQVDGVQQRVGPTSTVVAVAMLNAVVVCAVDILARSGVEPPVFISANIDGADAHNAALMARYRDRLTYL